MTSRPIHARWSAASLAIGAAALCAPLAPATAGPAAGSRLPDCFSALTRPGGARLVCQHQAWMTPQEQADIAKVTRGYLLDARCTVAVDIDRRLVDEAFVASDRAFALPPQPVTCNLVTSGGPMTVGGTFAPKVVFKDGYAVEASPGLANVTGVNSYLAWPVVAYVNGSPAITGEMVAMINAFRAHKLSQQAAR